MSMSKAHIFAPEQEQRERKEEELRRKRDEEFRFEKDLDGFSQSSTRSFHSNSPEYASSCFFHLLPMLLSMLSSQEMREERRLARELREIEDRPYGYTWQQSCNLNESDLIILLPVVPFCLHLHVLSLFLTVRH